MIIAIVVILNFARLFWQIKKLPSLAKIDRDRTHFIYKHIARTPLIKTRQEVEVCIFIAAMQYSKFKKFWKNRIKNPPPAINRKIGLSYAIMVIPVVLINIDLYMVTNNAGDYNRHPIRSNWFFIFLQPQCYRDMPRYFWHFYDNQHSLE